MCTGREQADGDSTPDERPLLGAPTDGLGDFLDVADEVGIERLPAGAHVLARGEQVLPADLERIEMCPPRHFVYLRLTDPLEVRRSERPVRAGGREVRVHAGG